MFPKRWRYGDNKNSTSTALASNGTWTGDVVDMDEGGFAGVVCSLLTDQDGTLYMEQSTNGTNWDSSLAYAVSAGVNEVHRLTVTRRYFRARFVNGSSAQSYLRLQTLFNEFAPITSALNSTIQEDADAVVVRSISEEIDIISGRREGFSIVNKYGRNPDISTATAPEDVSDSGGIYAGFPTGSPEEIEIVRSSASDTGSVVIVYMPTATSTAWVTSSPIALTGTNTLTGITAYRVHSAYYVSGNSTGFNIGTLTVRHATTTSNVFMVIQIGSSQSNTTAYRVPSGYTGYIQRITASVRSNTAATINGAVWVRSHNGSPRLRRPFTVTNGATLEDRIYGGLVIPANSDVMIRVTSSSANNIEVGAGYDMVLVKNI